MTFTTVKLDKARNIVLGFKAMQEFKNITGKSLTKINFEDENLEVEEIVPVIYYAGLKHEDKELTEEKTGEILDILFEEHGMEYVAEILGEAIAKAFGVKEAPGVSHSKNQ